MQKIITDWLKNILKLELNPDKTLIINLRKSKATFLGYTLFFLSSKVVQTIRKSTRVISKQHLQIFLMIGIDHRRVKKKLKNTQLIDSKKKVKHVGMYLQMKPWKIVEKFRQRFEELISYYYNIITYPNDLRYYYYVY